MVESLILAISEKIAEKMGEEYAVYTESVYQGAKKPCIFTECKRAERKELLNGRYFIRLYVKVIAEDDRDDEKYRTNKITAELFEILRQVDVGGKILFGRGIKCGRDDGRFVAEACYDVWMCEKDDENMMEKIEVKYDGS